MPKLSGDELKSKVYESLNNAKDNGYDLEDFPADLIADDLSEYDSFFEDYTTVELVPHIADWKNENA